MTRTFCVLLMVAILGLAGCTSGSAGSQGRQGPRPSSAAQGGWLTHSAHAPGKEAAAMSGL